MAYCSHCGTPTVSRIPEGDHLERQVCSNCGLIAYDNPKIIVSCLVHNKDGVLWVKRAEEPKRGFWVIPAGYLENNESLQEGAAREVMEETGVHLEPSSLALYTLGTLRYTNEVYIVFRCKVSEPRISLGTEALDAQFFTMQDAPWPELAYSDMELYIRRFYDELHAQKFAPYIGDFSELGNIIEDIQ